MKKSTLLLITLLNLTFIHAQETGTELDPVTVTATLAPEKASRTGRNVLVIGGERFQQLPVHSLDELLRFLPGIEVQMRGPAGSQSDIVLRGGTFQQVLVIIDGIRVNDANTGHFTSYIPISPAEIDRIEILKGASSAIYGSDAVGGVIHILTKAFVSRQPKKKINANVNLTAGEYRLFTVNASALVSGDNGLLNAGVLANNTDGQLQRGTRGFFHNKTASLSAGRFFRKNWQVSLRGSWDERDFSAQNFYTAAITDTARENVRTIWTQARVAHERGSNRIQADFGYKALEDVFYFTPSAQPNRNKSYGAQFLVTDVWKINTAATLTTGVQLQNRRIRSNDRGNHELSQGAFFVSLAQQLGKYVTVSPGMRFDWNESSGLEWIPQLNASVRKNHWQFRGSAGKTIRDADFTERFNNYGRALVPSGQRVGNAGLGAERSFSYEAGADYYASKNFKAGATWFQRYHHDLIDYVLTPYANMPRKDNLSPAGTYALARNISSVTTQGVETDIQFSQQINEQQSCWMTLGVTWLESKSSEPSTSFYISSHARWLVNFNVQYTWKWLSISSDGMYKKRQRQLASNPAIASVSPDYFVLNLRLEARLLQKRAGVFVRTDNVFDRSYTDLLGAPMPGRWLMGGLRYTFNR